MTARRLTFQLTPVLDLLLIVIFAQFMDVQDKAENQEQTSSAQVENLESSRDQTSSELAALKLAVEERALLVTAVARCCPVIPFGQCTLVLSVSRIEARSTLACGAQKLCLL